MQISLSKIGKVFNLAVCLIKSISPMLPVNPLILQILIQTNNSSYPSQLIANRHSKIDVTFLAEPDILMLYL